MKLRWFAAGMLIASPIVRGDIITLNDGSILHGRAQQTTDGWIVTRDDGKKVSLGPERIVSIQVVRTAAPPQAAMDGLASLRRAVDPLDDISQIIERYQRFISANTDPQALAAANQDLQTWQQREDQGLVKIGSRWVTPEQRTQLRQVSQTEALSARTLFLQNRTEEAEQLLKQALADDPQNATAIYIHGVQAYNRNQLTEARDAFALANSIAPNYGPTLNNMAVTSWRLGAQAPAMGFYDQAMLAAPVAQPILDNVAEALAALSATDSAAPLAQQAAADFRDQDTILRAARAKQDFYRWGSGWVTSDQLAQLQAVEDRVKQQLADLQSQFDAIQQRIGQIDSEVDQNTRQMHRIEASSYVAGENGIIYQLQLPMIYYQLSDDNRKLQQDRIVLQSQQDAVRNQMSQVQRQVVETGTPKYTGKQRLIGVESAPVRTPPASEPSGT
jgi:tetratricopeptide (TPR) repeat protein